MSKLINHCSKFALSLLLVLLASHTSAAQTDEYTVELYETYCQACHSSKATGAPLAFEPSYWQKIMSQGDSAVINRAISGAGNMPAQGGCMECSYEDFAELISYMSQAKPE